MVGDFTKIMLYILPASVPPLLLPSSSLRDPVKTNSRIELARRHKIDEGSSSSLDIDRVFAPAPDISSPPSPSSKSIDRLLRFTRGGGWSRRSLLSFSSYCDEFPARSVPALAAAAAAAVDAKGASSSLRGERCVQLHTVLWYMLEFQKRIFILH